MVGIFATTGADAAFVHPGLGLSQAELNKIKAEVNAGVQPRKAGWDKMMSYSSSYASLSYTPHPVADCQDGGGGDLCKDSLAAYTHSLIWVVTGNQANANKAIEIMNAWSSTLVSITSAPGGYVRQHVLVSGMTAQPFCEAAEIIRYTNAGWKATDITRFENMLKNAFLPNINTEPTENGNYEASAINSLLAIGVFCNDQTIYNLGVNFYRNGTQNGALHNYIYESGQCQETCRDQGHSMMGIGELVDAAEIAWHQGLDLYGDLPDPVTGMPRLAKGLEYTANVTNNICMASTCGDKCENTDISTQPMWEKGWNHYGNRMHRTDMKYTKYNAEVKGRPSGKSETNNFDWQTLTHSNMAIANTSVNAAIVTEPSAKISLEATKRGGIISIDFGAKLQKADIAILEINGKLFGKGSIANKSSVQLTMGRNLPNGMYIVRVADCQKTYCRTFVIGHQ